ncbi:MAG: aminodeoxychorismate synthase component I [Aquisalimonadaceae bacterium]
MRTLIIDNHDSFTWNLAQYITLANGEEPVVVRNDEMDWDTLVRSVRFDNIVISPGPGTVHKAGDFGISRHAIEHTHVPLLGVCLGHQGIAHAAGMRIVRAPEPMHGRESLVWHDGDPLFTDIPSPWRVIRYHSLLATGPLPASLRAIARTGDGLLMAVRNQWRRQWGVQFHPESILSEHGMQLLRNFRDLSATARGKSSVSMSGLAPGSHTAGTAPARQVYGRCIDTSLTSEDLFAGLYGDAEDAFWLDSSLVEPGLSRFSFLGAAEPGDRLVCSLHPDTAADDDFLDQLAAALNVELRGGEDLPIPFLGGWVGFLGYELKALCGARAAHASPYPDAVWLRAERFIAVDHQLSRAYLICLGEPGEDAEAQHWLTSMEQRINGLTPAPPSDSPPPAGGVLAVTLDQSRDEYLRSIERCKDAIRAGDSYEICLTNKMTVPGKVSGLELYRSLRRLNPAPFAAYLRSGELEIASASPERFIRVEPDGRVETKPIKGTCRRGDSPDQDRALAVQLGLCEKNRAENLMIVDLLRNDLSRVAETGSVHVPRMMYVETYATVHQLVSTVTATLRPECTLVDLIRAVFPGGSITGAPKLRTMEIIDELEKSARGVYCGAIGYLGYGRRADLSIAIRTLVITEHEVSLGAGGAITYLSDADDEFDETVLKADALLNALAHHRLGVHGPARYTFVPRAAADDGCPVAAQTEETQPCAVG